MWPIFLLILFSIVCLNPSKNIISVGFSSDSCDHCGLRGSYSDHFLFFKDFFENPIFFQSSGMVSSIFRPDLLSTRPDVIISSRLEDFLHFFNDYFIVPRSFFTEIFFYFSVILNFRLCGGFDHFPWNLCSRFSLVLVSVLNLC